MGPFILQTMRALVRTSGYLRYSLVLIAYIAHGAEFSTFIGDASEYHVVRVLSDSSGNTIVGGSRSLPGSAEAFVIKLDSAGKIVVFATLNGKGSDTVNDVATDTLGNVYLAGATTSVNLPLHNAFQNTPGPGFLAKFSPDLGQVLFSSYFPAAIQAMAV